MSPEQQRLAAVHIMTGIPQVGEIVLCDRRLWGEVLVVRPTKQICEILVHGMIGSNYPVRWGTRRLLPWAVVEPMRGRE